MSSRRFISDECFDTLVETLHGLTPNPETGSIERWAIKMALADAGVLPLRMASPIIESALAEVARLAGNRSAA